MISCASRNFASKPRGIGRGRNNEQHSKHENRKFVSVSVLRARLRWARGTVRAYAVVPAAFFASAES